MSDHSNLGELHLPKEVEEKAVVWQQGLDDPDLSAELSKVIAHKDSDALIDAFYQDLSFGTAGLRGVLGVGTNRMNIYTVGQATQGLADYLNKHFDKPSVVIVRDSRNKGEDFVKRAASILAANGISVHVAPRIEPVPLLSFMVKYLETSAGIAITASHNPASYNGYKVYGPDGCQIANEAADEIQHSITITDAFEGVRSMDFDEAVQKGLVTYVEDSVIEAYLDAIQKVSVPDCSNPDFKVVYTPLNGSGLECVTKILKRVGITNVEVVPEQKNPDGNFPTCPYPNPEFREALQKALELADKTKPDLVLATDPDADRVGVAVPHRGEYKLLTGNEVGILLTDWLAKLKPKDNVQDKVVITTIVSTDMPNAIAKDYGFEVRRVLTGFKFLGGQIDLLVEAGEENRFMLAFEESYGYLAGTHARDKDAIVASMLICEMAGWYAKQNRDLYEAIEALYEKYGYYMNGVVNVAFEGAEGAEKMAAIMSHLRSTPPTKIAAYDVVRVIDYNEAVPMPYVNQKSQDKNQHLPSANVLSYELEGGHKVMIRPSGTEPKIKAYLFAVGNSRENANEIINELSEEVKEKLFV